MRLFSALLFSFFSLTSAAAEDRPLSHDQERQIFEMAPADRRALLMQNLKVSDHMARELSNDIDYWLTRLPPRGVGIQIGPRDAAGGVGLPRMVVVVLGAYPQSSAPEQLCPGDVIRVVDGTPVAPLAIRKGDDSDVAIKKTLDYLDLVAGLLRNGKGDRVSVTVERSGKLVKLSPSVDGYRKFREYSEDRIASVREYLATVREDLERFRLVARGGQDFEVVSAIREAHVLSRQLADVSGKAIPADFGTPRFCMKE